ncbi:hypothetical protein KO361_00925 [Candidatus Woesearchaeota archaeon]|nr:hypothetical protein [Candidatus Woesearchaeota archaeon]
MVSIIGIDSRLFKRQVIKNNGEPGYFDSVLGVAVKVDDFFKFDEAYKIALNKAFKKVNKIPDYQYYCYNDIKDFENAFEILDEFSKQIVKHIEKIHVFYTLFSKKRVPEIKVYGRLSKDKKIKLNKPTMNYEELLNKHLTHCFPIVCAWRLSDYLSSETVNFHLDFFEGRNFEGYERLKKLGFNFLTYPSGDCCNPVISTADLLLSLLDMRLEKEKKFLIFENIRPLMPEFKEKVLVYPISNKHLPFITPLEKKSINTISYARHPVYWVFKGDELLNSGIMKRSPAYRNLIDLASSNCAVVKMFNKNKDSDNFKVGDYGVFINEEGKSLINNYIVLGKKLKLFDLNLMVAKSPKEKQKHLYNL